MGGGRPAGGRGGVGHTCHGGRLDGIFSHEKKKEKKRKNALPRDDLSVFLYY